jgi:hypothetical protein
MVLGDEVTAGLDDADAGLGDTGAGCADADNVLTESC